MAIYHKFASSTKSCALALLASHIVCLHVCLHGLPLEDRADVVEHAGLCADVEEDEQSHLNCDCELSQEPIHLTNLRDQG